MLFDEYFATSAAEVGVSMFDFYSIGHLCFGLGAFLILSLLHFLLPKRHRLPLWGCFLVTMVILVAWEIVENSLFIAMGIKFEGRSDSNINMITDIVIGTIGALINWLAAYEIEEHDDKGKIFYFIGGLIAFTIWIVVFVIFRYFTL